MMAAISASEAGAEVTLVEKNEKLGKKLYITGKGRCNVTNAAPMEDFFGEVVSNPKFLFSAFRAFTNEDMKRVLEEEGCPLKEERGARYFPVSDRSSDVTAALQRRMKRDGVRIRLNTEVKELLTEEDPEGKKRVTGLRLSDGSTPAADAVILATGGCSYPSTGSTGDGYAFAKKLDLQVTEPVPSLVPLECKGDECRKMQGLALKNVGFRLELDGKTRYDGFGEMLFTHFGISGPLVLTASCYYNKPGKAVGIIDLKPALTPEELDKRLLRDLAEQPKKQWKNVCGGLLPSGMIPVFCARLSFSEERRACDITGAMREEAVSLLKAFPLEITGKRPFAEAIITQGGLGVKGFSPSTMECKQVAGLYAAGEVLDLDAHTGGFNLQIAWSTGFLAGKSAAAE